MKRKKKNIAYLNPFQLDSENNLCQRKVKKSTPKVDGFQYQKPDIPTILVQEVADLLKFSKLCVSILN